MMIHQHTPVGCGLSKLNANICIVCVCVQWLAEPFNCWQFCACNRARCMNKVHLWRPWLLTVTHRAVQWLTAPCIDLLRRAVTCRATHWLTAPCTDLQGCSVTCSAVQRLSAPRSDWQRRAAPCSDLQRRALAYSAVQWVAVPCTAVERATKLWNCSHARMRSEHQLDIETMVQMVHFHNHSVANFSNCMHNYIVSVMYSVYTVKKTDNYH